MNAPFSLSPTWKTAYRYYADMLAKQGDMAKARIMLIHAAVAEPYNRTVWRELHAWGDAQSHPYQGDLHQRSNGRKKISKPQHRLIFPGSGGPITR